MWQLYHVFYCAWIRRVPPQLKLTLCLRKDTLLHWCGWGLAISAGLATKSLATGAGGHCGQGSLHCRVVHDGQIMVDYDSIVIMLDVIDSWIVPLRQPIISSPKDSSSTKPEHNTGTRSLHLRGFASRTYETFWSQGFSRGIRSDSRGYWLRHM